MDAVSNRSLLVDWPSHCDWWRSIRYHRAEPDNGVGYQQTGRQVHSLLFLPSPEAHKFYRSQHLYVAFAIRYVADLISPQVASFALEHSLWLPTFIAGACAVASYPIVALMDEPLRISPVPENTDLEESALLSESGTLKRLLTNSKVVLCMCITFLLQFRYINQSVLISYASVRFAWSIAQVKQPQLLPKPLADTTFRSRAYCP